MSSRGERWAAGVSRSDVNYTLEGGNFDENKDKDEDDMRCRDGRRRQE